jgi:hypothetical protein
VEILLTNTGGDQKGRVMAGDVEDIAVRKKIGDDGPGE